VKEFGLPRAKRIIRKQDFDRVYQLQQRTGDQYLLVFAARNGLPWTRIGLSVSRKQGNAVVRARIKRLLREAFRLQQHELPKGLDLVLIPRKDSGAQLRDYQQSLMRAARKLDRRIPPPEEIRGEGVDLD
jgi:ribonuclease P protein component